MSETTTNLLTGFQVTSSKGGELFGDGGTLFGETSDDKAVSFSSVLDQAQGDQADGSEFAKPATRLARETSSDALVHDRNNLPLEESRELRPEPQAVNGRGRAEPSHRSVDSRESLGGEPESVTHDPLQDASEPTDTVKPAVATRVSAENSDSETTDSHVVFHDNGRRLPEHLATDVSESEVQVSAVPHRPARPEVALESTRDVELNSQARHSTALPENLPTGQPLGPQRTAAVDVPLTTSPAPGVLSETALAVGTSDGVRSNEVPVGASAPLATATEAIAPGAAVPGAAAPGATAPGLTTASSPSLTVVTDAEQPIVSAAAFANRLNGQPVASVTPAVMQPVSVNPVSNAGTDAEQLTTIAGIQSVQAGISGLAQTSSGTTAASSAVVTTVDSVNSTAAALTPVTAASTFSSGQSSDPVGQSVPTNLNPVTTGVNPALTSASNIPLSNANTPPASSTLVNGNAQSLLVETTVESQLGMATPAAAVAKDSLAPVSLSPVLDNMLSTPASGIVTAPILAKADLTGTPIAQTPLNVPLLTPAATEAMVGNVRWMVGEGIQNAVVNVSPNGMGPISVQIGLEKEQMSISIVASQANTREALESMLPRLRDQLSTQGVETVRVDISDGRGDRSGSFTGFDRQNMGYTTADSQQNSQQRNTNAQDSENHSTELSDSNVNDSGERTLSESEHALVDQLKSSSTNSSVKNVSISHGYDLYV